MYEDYLWKNAGMNESTEHPQIHAPALLVFLSRRFRTGVETRRTFHRRLAACIETTHLSSKKTAVINVHYALHSLHTL